MLIKYMKEAVFCVLVAK